MRMTSAIMGRSFGKWSYIVPNSVQCWKSELAPSFAPKLAKNLFTPAPQLESASGRPKEKFPLYRKPKERHWKSILSEEIPKLTERGPFCRKRLFLPKFSAERPPKCPFGRPPSATTMKLQNQSHFPFPKVKNCYQDWLWEDFCPNRLGVFYWSHLSADFPGVELNHRVWAKVALKTWFQEMDLSSKFRSKHWNFSLPDSLLPMTEHLPFWPGDDFKSELSSREGPSWSPYTDRVLHI